MLLTAEHLRTLQALAPSENVTHPSARVSEDEDDLYRVLDVQGLVRPQTNQSYDLTDDGREALRLLQEMLAAGDLSELAQAPAGWRFLGSEVLASLAAAERVGGQVGPVCIDLLRARGFVDAPAAKSVRGATRLNRFGTAWLEWARRHKPRLEITGALAQSLRRMPVAYAEPHMLDIPAAHRAQLEAMDLLAWSVPDGQAYTLSALGHAVRDALAEGGYPVADVVLNDELLSQLDALQEQGEKEQDEKAITQEQLANVQALGYVDAQGQLTPAGQAALRARRLREAEPARHPATFAISHEEAELLGVVQRLSAAEESAKQQATTKGALHKALIERLERRYQEMVGHYGRTINEVPARKREAETLLAELRERDRAFADPASLDDLLVRLESFDLLRAEGSGHETVYRVTPLGHALLQGQDQGQAPHDVTATAVKAITLTTRVFSLFWGTGRLAHEDRGTGTPAKPDHGCHRPLAHASFVFPGFLLARPLRRGDWGETRRRMEAPLVWLLQISLLGSSVGQTLRAVSDRSGEYEQQGRTGEEPTPATETQVVVRVFHLMKYGVAHDQVRPNDAHERQADVSHDQTDNAHG